MSLRIIPHSDRKCHCNLSIPWQEVLASHPITNNIRIIGWVDVGTCSFDNVFERLAIHPKYLTPEIHSILANRRDDNNELVAGIQTNNIVLGLYACILAAGWMAGRHRAAKQ